MRKMNPKVKKLWLAALLSGKYKQGHGRLRNSDDEYCCLGVLCDIHRKVTKKKDNHWVEDSTGYASYKNKKSNLSDDIKEWAKIISSSEIKLIEMNDKEKKSFKQIANWIQKNL